MSTIPITCNNCGAALDIGQGVRFTTCAFCKSRLEIKRTASAVYSEVLESVARQTEHISENVDRLMLQNELERLDREWMMQRKNFMVRGKQGTHRAPGRSGAVAVGLFGVVGGVAWMVFALVIGAGFFACFGLLFIGFAIFMAVYSSRKVKQYEMAQREFDRKRAQLVRRIDESSSA